ncbi:MAG TPA: hypothetical protein VHI76_01525 [Solirubrobacterales bacterium]|jgi:hypothetical protein|nr:hypothetical protein [Solirubrobacterales bacterium]
MEQGLIDGIRLTAERRVDEEYLAELRRGDREPFAAELFARSVTAGATVVDCRASLGGRPVDLVRIALGGGAVAAAGNA